MCYSLEASRNIFILNILTCLTVYYTTSHKVLAQFFAYIGLIQLFDYILWSNQDLTDPSQEKTNRSATVLSMLTLNLQPIVLALLITQGGMLLQDKSKIVVSIYTVVIAIYSWYIYGRINHTVAEDIGGVQSLNWRWTVQPYNEIIYGIYIFCLILLFYEHFTDSTRLIMIFVTMMTYLAAKINFKNSHAGRMWCKLGAFIPLVLLFKTE